jgi:large-conductance mechanosensitive channel
MKSGVKNSLQKIKIINNIIILFIIMNTNEFIDFINERQVISIGLGLIIASQLAILTQTITTSLINPIVNKILGDNTKQLSELTINIFGIEIFVGKIISQFINLLLILILLFYIWKILKKYEKNK